MKHTSKLTAAILLTGSVSLAVAQTPARSAEFAEQFRQQQALSSGSVSLAFKPAQTPGAAPDQSVQRESFADRFARMQAASSNSGEFKFPVESHGAYAKAQTEDADASRPSLRERFARFFQRGATHVN